jgi:hypothetical protein
MGSIRSETMTNNQTDSYLHIWVHNLDIGNGCAEICHSHKVLCTIGEE